MNLKTLKDIDIEFTDTTYQGNCDKEDVREKLKAEAIKWVKEFERRQIFLSDWLKFFNITEEGLNDVGN